MRSNETSRFILAPRRDLLQEFESGCFSEEVVMLRSITMRFVVEVVVSISSAPLFAGMLATGDAVEDLRGGVLLTGEPVNA